MKYEALWNYVGECGNQMLQLTFEEINQIAGIPIDHSFLNEKKVLQEYGYEVLKISMKEKTVTFLKME